MPEPMERERLIALARLGMDGVSWRAFYAVEHPDEPISAQWQERAQDELASLGQELYEHIVPPGHRVVREAEWTRYRAFVEAWSYMDGIELCFMDGECSREDVIKARERFQVARAALPDDEES